MTAALPDWGAVTRGGLAVASGVLLALSLPAPDVGWLAWFALAPLLLAVAGLTPPRAALLGCLTGLVATIGTFYWVLDVPDFKLAYFAAGVVYLALYPAVWAGLAALLPDRPAVRIALLPALWVAVESLRCHAGLLAVPWAALAHTQHRDISLLQVAALTGEAGISFLIVLGNVAIADALRCRRFRLLAIPAAVVLAAHLVGAAVRARDEGEPSLRVGVVQPSLALEDHETPARREASLATLESLTFDAALRGAQLIVWPESAVPDLALDADLPERLQTLADRLDVVLVAGTSESRKFVRQGPTTEFRVRSYNTAVAVIPREPLPAPYRKMILMPFGEYLPFADRIPYPAWAKPWAADCLPGDEPTGFAVPGVGNVAAMICWEGLFAGHVRRLVTANTRLLAHLTNAVWCGRSGGSMQHEIAAILRAVENGVPVAIASNAGPSMIVDRHGCVVAQVPGLFTVAAVVADVPLGDASTPYRAWGDVFALLCAIVSVAALLVAVASRMLAGTKVHGSNRH